MSEISGPTTRILFLDCLWNMSLMSGIVEMVLEYPFRGFVLDYRTLNQHSQCDFWVLCQWKLFFVLVLFVRSTDIFISTKFVRGL